MYINRFLFLYLFQALILIAIHLQVFPESLNHGKDAACMVLARGASFTNRDDRLFVVISLELYRNMQKKSELADRYEEAVDQFLPLIEEKKNATDDLLKISENIYNIQNTSYENLKSSFEFTNKLVQRSTENTDAALKLMHKLKWRTYLVAGLLGGITGGSISASNERFNIGGGLIGLGSGLLLNFIFIDFL